MPNDIGRPTVMDELTLQKLEIAYSNDATDEQACFLANISPATLYNYQKEHPEFIERKKALKSMTSYQAKANIREIVFSTEPELLKERLEASKWVLPKKEKAEYSERTELTGKDGNDLIPKPILTYALSSNNSNNQDNVNDKENTSDTGGDICVQDNINTPILNTPSTERHETNID